MRRQRDRRAPHSNRNGPASMKHVIDSADLADPEQGPRAVAQA
jgi:hypothetical protein